ASTVSFIFAFDPPILSTPLETRTHGYRNRIGPDGLFHAEELSTGLQIAPVLPWYPNWTG
ncbi:unnamed protein product, partial [Musa banksii]